MKLAEVETIEIVEKVAGPIPQVYQALRPANLEPGLEPPSQEPHLPGLMNRTAWLAAAKILAFVLAFALPLILVRRLSQYEFGLYKQAFQILATALSLLCLQVSASAYYFLPRESERKGQVVWNIVVFYAVLGALATLVCALTPRWVTLIFQSDDLAPVMPLLGVALLTWLLASNLEAVMIANGDIKISSVMIVCVQLLKTSLLIAAGVAFGTIHAIVTAAALFGIVHLVITLGYLYWRFGRFWRSFNPALFKAQLANSLPFGLGSIAYIVQNDLHNYYVSYYFTPAEFAIYSIGCFQLPLLLVLFDSVDTVMLPEIARLEKEADTAGIIRSWAYAMRMLAFVYMPACALMFVLRYELITTLFTKQYAASVPIFAINLLNMLLLINLTNGPMRALAELKYLRLKLNLLLLPVTWLALYLGIKYAGLVGAISAVAFLRVLDAGSVVIAVGRKLGMTWHDLRHFAPVGRIFIAAVVAAIPTALFRAALPPEQALLILVGGSVVFGLAFVLALFGCGAVSTSEQTQLREMFFKFYRPGNSLPATPEI